MGHEGIDLSVEKLHFLKCLFNPYLRSVLMVRLQMQEAIQIMIVVFMIQKVETGRQTEYNNYSALITW